MRLSLRTLLAFEDNVFDVEQHRRLEQLLPADKAAEATLRRIRSIVRNPSLGVPGLVDHQEELDPNYVAEYLDHQMSGSVQEKFETYCLSADKYLAEIASVHHILSNVLGEPARTSRECRLRCYNVLLSDTALPAFSAPEPQTHFKPYEAPPPEPPKSKADKPARNRYFASLWERLFPVKPAPETQPQVQAVQEEKRSPLWTFTILGLLVCALLLGWQQIEKQRLAQQPFDLEAEMLAKESETMFPTLSPPFAAENHFVADAYIVENYIVEYSVFGESDLLPLYTNQQIDTNQQNDIAATNAPLEPLAPLEPITQVAYTAEVFTPFTVAPLEDAPADNAAVENTFTVLPLRPIDLEPFASEGGASDGMLSESGFVHTTIMENTAITENVDVRELPMLAETMVAEEMLAEAETEETIVAFQPILPLARSTSEFVASSNVQDSPTPSSSWQAAERASETAMPASAIQQPVSVAAVQAAVQQSLPNPPPIAQVSATATPPIVVGRAVQACPLNLIFSATSADASWQLLPLPFDLNGDQYLLTAAPFRGTFELAARFRIEMIGDAKLCILPPDASGTPGIFVDYGRIVIYPLQANQPLRIETERARGTVSSTGTESVLFIDTFAEVSEPPSNIRTIEEQKPKRSPILGFVPGNGERIVWQSATQPQPFFADAQGSVLLQSDRYRFGEVRNLPNWLGAMPVSAEDRLLAEVCRRYFAEAQGNGEQALTRLIQDKSPAVRTLGLRLWGDLGRFDVPIAAVAERRQGEESIRHVLNQYFEEVMRRDEETVQRFADAIQNVREAQRH